MLKKFITRVLGGALVLATGAALAQAPTGPLELAPDAPDTYIVVKGDTLWDISGRFLKTPWRWPEIWRMNREQISNPHLIYPGDIVYLDRTGASPRLRLGRSVAGSTDETVNVRSFPATRATPAGSDAIPTINLSAIAPFLNRPLVVDAEGLKSHPRIVATQDGRVYLGRGDLAYARGIKDESVTEWHAYRPAKPLLDPATRQTIGWEALYVGSLQLVKGGDPSSLRVISNTEEIGEGDRLMPASRAPVPLFAPRAPDAPVDGRIVSVYRGVDQVGKLSVVALSVGSQQGLEVGHVLKIQATGRTIVDRETNESVRLPNEAIGQLMVFRVFDRIAYGLVMAASHPIAVGATVTNP